MSERLLLTKFQIPPSKRALLPRHRLMARLNKAAEHKLTLISAPAGFGKTTLLSAWAAQLTLPVSWLSLDENDNDPARFLSYLISSIQSSELEVDLSKLPVPESLDATHVEPVAIPLLNALASLPAAGIILLDDFHLIDTPMIHQFLSTLVENLPPPAHIIISTRADPPLRLPRLRARDDLFELRAADLRFSLDETGSFLTQETKLALSDKEIATIQAKSEGWPAAVRLASIPLKTIALRNDGDAGHFIEGFSGTNEYIADYLTDEVLDGLPVDIRSFLLKSSVLERLSGALCRATTGEVESQSMLERLERDNIFLTSLDGRRTWYRFHPLFADLLRKRLALTYSDEIPRLHDRAATWYQENDLIPEAISHAFSASDDARAAALIEENVLDSILQGDFYQAHSWLDQLPEQTLQSKPVLLIALAWISIRTQTTDRTLALVAAAEARAGELGWDSAAIAGLAATLRAIIARTEGKPPEEQRDLILKALEIVPVDDLALRAILQLRLGFCHMDLGQEREADEAFRQAVDMGRAGDHHYNLYLAIYARTIIAFRQGRLYDVSDICRQSLLTSTRQEALPWKMTAAQGFAYIALGLVELEWNELDGAQTNLERGLALNTASGLLELQVKGQYGLARLMLAQGGQPLPIDVSRLSRDLLPALSKFAAALQAHLWHLSAQNGQTQDRVKAEQWAESETAGLAPGFDKDWQIKRQLIRLRIILSQGMDPVELERLPAYLDDLVTSCQPQKWNDRLIELLVVKAIILERLKRTESAVGALVDALAMAESGGYARIFLDEGKPMARLLYRCLEQGHHPDYVSKLLSQFEPDLSAAAETPSASRIEPLTPREIELLKLIADGLTNKEIGQELSISLGTVKRHTANINGKLNVHSRTQAAAVARALRILP